MKQKFQVLMAICFTLLQGVVFNSFAQAPQKFNYQGIARDAQGNPLAKKQLSLKLTILPTADAVDGEYEETQLVTTNEFGLYTLQIGNGKSALGSMKNVTWETGNKYIKVAIDPQGGTQFVDAGTTQLLSVPYAIYADKAGIAKETIHGGSTNGTRAGTSNFLSKFDATGSSSAEINSQIFDNGTNIGIGTTSPGGKLHSRVTSGNNLTIFENTNASGVTRQNFQADGTLNYCTVQKRGSNVAGNANVTTMPLANMFSFGNNTGPMLLNSQGNMGIAPTISGVIQYKFLTDTLSGNVGLAGNAIPTARVHVNNTQATSVNMRLTNNTTGHTATDGLVITENGTTASIINTENSTLSLGTNNASRMIINPTNVDINNPVVSGATLNLGNKIGQDTSSLGFGGSFDEFSIFNNEDGKLVFNANSINPNLGTPIMTLDDNGVNGVGIGTQTPTAKLDVLGGQWDLSTTDGDLKIGDATRQLKMGIAFGGGGDGHATIAANGGINTLSLGTGNTYPNLRTVNINDGNVGIGTAPGYKLHVDLPSGGYTSVLETSASSYNYLGFRSNGLQTAYIGTFLNPTTAFDINSNIGDLNLAANYNTLIKLKLNGKIGMGIENPHDNVTIQNDRGTTQANLAVRNSGGGVPGIKLVRNGSNGIAMYGTTTGLNIGDSTGGPWAAVNASAFNVSSDRRMKKEIKTILSNEFDSYLTQIRNIESATYRYDWENEESRKHPHVGFISQSLPNEVKAYIDLTANGESGEKRIGYNLSDMAGLTLLGVKAVDKKTTDLEKQLQAQQVIIELLQKEIELLKNK